MRISTKLQLALAGGCVLVAAALPAGADTVYLQSGSGKPVALEGVKVQSVQDKSVTFTTAAGVTNTKSLDHIPEIHLDDEPAFTAAEAAFAKGEFPAAADGYRKAISATSKDWVKDRSSMRLVEAADKSGNFGDAVAGFIELMKTKPALASEHKPSIPKNQPAALDPAIALVKQESTDPKLTADQKTVLLNYLLELYGAKGDSASAQAIIQQLGKVMPADANSAGGRHIQADSKLAEANQLLQQHQYPQAVQTLEGSSALFTDPNQQAEALYVIAQSKAGAARPDDPDQLKDAALAFMRVVAVCKDMEGKPHVADALYYTAGIEEKLKNSKEAIALYNQVASEFKASPLAPTAEQNAARLSAASAAPKG
jgi:tetratricopeptide (TPR) repeat protein